jgi:hypothetical protein
VIVQQDVCCRILLSKATYIPVAYSRQFQSLKVVGVLLGFFYIYRL